MTNITVATDGFWPSPPPSAILRDVSQSDSQDVLDEEVITLPFFVRKSTSLPAAIMGWHDRGWIKKGYRADIVVFDLETARARATFGEMDLYSERPLGTGSRRRRERCRPAFIRHARLTEASPVVAPADIRFSAASNLES